MRKKDLSSDELDTLRRSRNSPVILTASGEVHTNEEAEVFVHYLDLFVTVQVLDWTPVVLSLGTLRRPRIFLWVTQRSKKHGWPNRRRRFYAKQTTSYLLLFQEFSTSSGGNSSSTSTSQDLSSTSPAQERSGELAPRVWCGSPSETFKKKERGMTVEMRTICEIFLNGWRRSQIIQRTQNCMHLHPLQDSDSERPTKVVSKSKSRRHSSYIHFKTDRNCEVYLRTKMTRAPCSRRTGEVLPRVEKFWITEQSLVRCRGSRSCHSMDSILSVQNKDFTGDGKEFTKIPQTVAKKQQLFMRTVHWNMENLVKIYHGIIEPQQLTDPRLMASLKEPFEE